MLNYLRSLFFPSGEITETLHELTKLIKAPVTKSSLKQSLEDHPDYPSLLSVSDVLEDFGIENISVKTSADRAINIAPPFIAQVTPLKSNSSSNNEVTDSIQSRSDFVLVSEIDNNKVKLFVPRDHRWTYYSFQHFKEIYQGVLLLAEAGENAGEKDHNEKNTAEKWSEGSYFISFLSIPILTIVACVYYLTDSNIRSLTASLNLVLMCLGSIVSFLLLLYEFDEFNPVLKEICTSSRNTDCKAVLTSKQSKIFGQSWSSVGFFYFASNSFLLLTLGSNSNTQILVAWLSLISLPFTVFSLYYQARIVKQWCRLCLTIQAILVGLFVINLSGGNFKHMSIDTQFIITALTCISATFISLSVILPLLKKLKVSQNYKKRFTELIRNPNVFNSLLKDQKIISQEPGNIGIVLGNRKAKHKIIKVCNPYCPPCAKSHSILEELLSSNEDLQLQIVFNATTRPDDDKAIAVRHFLAIAANQDELSLRKALNDWYSSDIKDYVRFSGVYPVTNNDVNENENIELMRTWCDNNRIESTPTLFVDGHLLPQIYSSEDLKYLLKMDNSSLS
ncbi:putative membrane protein [Dyadobacter sp. BE34]|uniref:Membrane protein n=1 Tax=Dyadobacter fermentans TaxID=94254 RepID=A0ABU1QTQ6_9BACT|nr:MULTISPECIES: vitamin K epoxide reductase family protein [Dyadobacter]MDR6804559.1 putative membrane protein [Dyadobacter fermentans]MDR7042299.1 putative membrane protein [Dyadobacter sp. BE242]MDR7196701.1 putative membrane protein [Dyadobacter sp. BE34]MDR7212754.1 putative membrane protein [Dyadobacter sp. BE31]MDR7262108.1 putative membrane protein [Dyadobacter sp. BE32]